ncbi:MULTISPECIES: substrate-binding domain-containing protein [unclassified Coleofasciculus]|uniref:substrate-binding domain-containing protein n=1 Tax=unclassified Coleofasciculus TaxID=2692782 RepID=UPI0018820A4B|nr:MULTISPECIES: substrate-binding domain-containing protein [unclassified Coleofasciculus]MBE9125084.1 substrate-binding domain-containing protein [Coleofasciculus sp. LEGE 07081]MBE9150087.1 substrate-binding domain-containing protein [Coleofasciculus sp. LEGE 07092]
MLAQSTAPESFELPPSVPRGTTVQLDGSTSMIKVNQALKERFEKQYPGTTIELNAQGSDAALQALLDGEIDLAAIGRPLTGEEKAQGLVQVPLNLQKIAIITAPDNPFQGDVTFKQFSQIFRGEINDWSEIGGDPGEIKLIDRPDYSDTRRAFQRYDVFKAAPFETGTNATQIDQDSTQEVIKQLGANGIGYAIADQVLEMKPTEVKIIPMHKVFPDDPRYPFSQTLSYVYKEPPTPPVEAFVGYATDPSNEEVVDEAIAQTTTEPDIEDAPDSTPATEPESENAVACAAFSS